MRTVILEEHFAVPAVSARVSKDTIARRGYKLRAPRKDVGNPLALLPDLGEQRLKAMDEAGIDVEVLSNSGRRLPHKELRFLYHRRQTWYYFAASPFPCVSHLLSSLEY